MPPAVKVSHDVISKVKRYFPLVLEGLYGGLVLRETWKFWGVIKLPSPSVCPVNPVNTRLPFASVGAPEGVPKLPKFHLDPIDPVFAKPTDALACVP